MRKQASTCITNIMEVKILLLVMCCFFISCGEGYQKVDGKWAWVLRSEAGKHVRKLNVDQSSFKIFNNKSYAKDKKSVFFEGEKIDLADPETFEIISDNGYAKDKNYVFIESSIVIFASPDKFKILDWPYSRDDKKIYNGNLPMNIKNVDEFKVTKSSDERTSFMKEHFIEMHSDYKWLDTINIKGIIISKNAEARTSDEMFKGIEKLN